MAVRRISAHLGPPMERARMSETSGDGGDGDSRRRTAASMDSSSNGLRLCLTPAVMIAVFVGLTRGRIYVARRGWVSFLLFLCCWQRINGERGRERGDLVGLTA